MDNECKRDTSAYSSDHKTQAQNLRQAFQGLTVGLFAFDNGDLGKRLEAKKILFAAEGSRAFRSPNGLGELPYEGCAIVFFADDLGDIQETFMKNAGKSALRIDDIESHKVAVFQEKSEQDVRTTFVVFPMKNIVIVATNRDYLGSPRPNAGSGNDEGLSQGARRMEICGHASRVLGYAAFRQEPIAASVLSHK
jgi:hypothetical protein